MPTDASQPLSQPLPGGTAARVRQRFQRFANPPHPPPRTSIQAPIFGGLTAALVGFYLALHAFYANDVMAMITGRTVPITALLAVLLPTLWLLVSSSRLRFAETGIAKIYVMLLAWWLLSAAIMSYKGYWFEIAEYSWRFHMFPFVLCGLLVTLQQIRTALIGYGSGFVVALLVCWKYGQNDEAGRFVIPHTSLANPNDLAMNLLLGVAILSILVVNTGFAKRAFYIVVSLVGFYYVLKTGSRSNFLTLGVVLLAAWIISSRKVRMIMVVGCLASALLILPLVPKETWTRLTTFTEASSEELARNKRLAEAIGSTEARKQLQIRAIKLTLQYPVFGVGPRMYIYALDEFMKEEGFQKGTWQHPHNTYLDYASETGIPGVLMYVVCVLWCIRSNYRSVRAAQRNPRLKDALGQSTCLYLAAVVYAFGTLFCSIPYFGHLPFLTALTAANWLALRDAGAFTEERRIPQWIRRKPVKPAAVPVVAHQTGVIASR